VATRISVSIFAICFSYIFIYLRGIIKLSKEITTMRSRHAVRLLLSRISLVIGGLALLVLLGTQSVRTSAATPAYIRVIHASPAVGTADVFVDGNLLLSSFAFGAVTDYVPLPAGPHKVQIALVGKGIGAAAITQTLAVQPGVVYTAAAIGSQATDLSIIPSSIKWATHRQVTTLRCLQDHIISTL
jgi:hypothetical protein